MTCFAKNLAAEAKQRKYGWPKIPAELHDLPLFIVDVDGTVRGDVVPMVRLARPLVPNYLKKIVLLEPLNAVKAAQLLWNLSKLWTLRTINREHRRRYKHLFSELHNLAAALLRGMEVEALRARYREFLPHMDGLWSEGAVELLRRATRRSLVVLVTGSEQVQTEECVQLLAGRGVDVERIFVRGSLYGCQAAEQRYTGVVHHLNVTLEGKSDALQSVLDSGQFRCVAAAGNSRPDRCLFDAIEPSGLRLLVCPSSVLEKRKARTFVIRKLRRVGYQLHWEVTDYLAALQSVHRPLGGPRPLLATDRSFENVLDHIELTDQFAEVLGRVANSELAPVG
jgi:phosphoserine phosphatase